MLAVIVYGMLMEPFKMNISMWSHGIFKDVGLEVIVVTTVIVIVADGGTTDWAVFMVVVGLIWVLFGSIVLFLLSVADTSRAMADNRSNNVICNEQK